MVPGSSEGCDAPLGAASLGWRKALLQLVDRRSGRDPGFVAPTPARSAVEVAAAAVPPPAERRGHWVGPTAATPWEPVIDRAGLSSCNHGADCPLQSSLPSPRDQRPTSHCASGPFQSHFSVYKCPSQRNKQPLHCFSFCSLFPQAVPPSGLEVAVGGGSLSMASSLSQYRLQPPYSLARFQTI